MKKLLFLVFLVSAVSTYAQKVKVVEGNLTPLKGEKEINVEFTYDHMTIGKDKQKEEDYLKRKKDDYDKKEPGRGDKFEKSWYNDRKDRFEPQFLELFEKHAKMVAKSNARYTLIFHTTRTEPGWNVGVMRAAARIDGEVWIVESGNRKNIIAKMTVTNAPGRDVMGFDYDTGLRLQEAYAKSGKEVGQLIAK
jgi:hypothetical protein